MVRRFESGFSDDLNILMTKIKEKSKKLINTTVVVAPGTRGPRFESSHWQNLIMNLSTANC